MLKNEEIVKFIFKETDKISYSVWSYNFLEQILNSDSSFILDTDRLNDLYVWKNGIWKNGTWQEGTWENGIWQNGIWGNGIWKNGKWKNGTWKNGNWIKGKVYNKNTKQYQESKLPPNQVEWSYSYGKK